MSPFRLAYLNLWRRKGPSLIALLAIALSVACSGMLLRLSQLSESRFAHFGAGGDAIVGAKAGGIEILLGALNGEGPYPGFLPFHLFQSLRDQETVQFEDKSSYATNYIRSVIPLVAFAKLGPYRVIGTDDSFFHRPVKEDSPELSEGHLPQNLGEVVAGAAVPSAVGEIANARVWVGSELPGALPLQVVGKLRPAHTAWDRMLFSNLASARRILEKIDLHERSTWGPDVLNYFLVYLNPEGFPRLSELVNRRTVGQAVLVGDAKGELQTLTGTGTKLGLFLTALVLALGALSVAAMLLTRFEAMALQLAVLRALGYRRSVITRWLLWEGAILGFCACVLGAALDWAVFPFLRSLLAEALPAPEIAQSMIWQSWPVWTAALLATIASVFLPLYRAYRQDVHFSLRN